MEADRLSTYNYKLSCASRLVILTFNMQLYIVLGELAVYF